MQLAAKETILVVNGIITTFCGSIMALVVGVEGLVVLSLALCFAIVFAIEGALFGLFLLFTCLLNPRIHQRRYDVLGRMFCAKKTRFGTIVVPGILKYW